MFSCACVTSRRWHCFLRGRLACGVCTRELDKRAHVFSFFSFFPLSGLVLPLFLSPLTSVPQCAAWRLAGTGQGWRGRELPGWWDGDPCTVDDDKLLTTNQPAARIIMLIVPGYHPPQLPHPFIAPPYARPWLRIKHTYRAGQGYRAEGDMMIARPPSTPRRLCRSLCVSGSLARRPCASYACLTSPGVVSSFFPSPIAGAKRTRLFPVPVRRAPRVPG